MTLEEWDKKLLTPEQAKIRRRLRRNIALGYVLGALGALVFGVVIIIMAYVFLAITPSQRSAEADLVAEQIELGK